MREHQQSTKLTLRVSTESHSSDKDDSILQQEDSMQCLVHLTAEMGGALASTVLHNPDLQVPLTTILLRK